MILAQHGYGKSDKLDRGLQSSAIRGVILSPRDESPSNLETLAADLRNQYPNADVLFDPQFYASVLSNANDGRLPEYTAYYTPGLTRSSFLSAKAIAGYVEGALDYQVNLGVTRLIAPTVAVENFQDPWSQVALSMAQAATDYHASLKDPPPLLLSVVCSETALDSEKSVEELLDLLSVFDVAGFYLVVRRLLPYSPAFEAIRLKNLLYTVYALAEINSYDVVCGYSDICSLLLHAVGAEATATGWHNGLRHFSLARFQAREAGGRAARPRYTSAPLLNSILVSELDAISYVGQLRSVLSRTQEDRILGTVNAPSDAPWPLDVATLHHWRVLSTLVSELPKGSVATKLDAVLKKIGTAEATYSLLRARGVDFESTSSEDHLEQWRQAIEGFRNLVGV